MVESEVSPRDEAAFDEYAADYDAALNQGIAVSGEDKYFFAKGRVEWLAKCLAWYQYKPKRVLDFGCGTGSSTPFLLDVLGADSVVGVDISAKLVKIAQESYGSARAQFARMADYQPNAQFDLAFCSGVFHHIPLYQRATSLKYIFDSLRPGSLFALWENNPWNLGTRYVMAHIPFDKGAITLSPPTAQRLLQSGGFRVLRTDFLFIFPKMLAPLRAIEPALSRLPLGAQYQVLGRKS
ncbi:MAG TPA: class I SAM-dependent methyltransferase [Anaerolineae bacterium]|nr:class I SAM-dependent methyltransferase [Anaerolineae bacterium]